MQYADADSISALNDLDWELTQKGITVFTSAAEIDGFLQAMFHFGVDSRPMAIPSGFAVEIDGIHLSRLAEFRLWVSDCQIHEEAVATKPGMGHYGLEN